MTNFTTKLEALSMIFSGWSIESAGEINEAKKRGIWGEGG